MSAKRGFFRVFICTLELNDKKVFSRNSRCSITVVMFCEFSRNHCFAVFFRSQHDSLEPASLRNTPEERTFRF